MSETYVFGIRHHGPGSARSLRRALGALKPDVILVEGPPEGDVVLPLVTNQRMQPPVALLTYVPDEPKRAVFYPFAIFSPEWQALLYGRTHGVDVRFMDLPQSHQMALGSNDDEEEEERDRSANGNDESNIRSDPLTALAQTAGYGDGERWWEQMVEHREDTTQLFLAIMEAMTALRESQDSADASSNEKNHRLPLEREREAYMRNTIRAAHRDGFNRIAVVCGAWHAPALASMPSAREDAQTLKGLPKVKVLATWVPWTYGRLSYFSGYGAGIESPGWYHHLWNEGLSNEATTHVAVSWLTRVAHLLREQDLDASAAHIIEALRLAESLTSLRDKRLPGLMELNEAIRSVFCFGNDVPLHLIHEKLIVGEVLGSVPDETPTVPLQRDLQKEQKRLRLPSEATRKEIDLDLRKPNDLDRSRLLHRLGLLDVPWGEAERVSGKKGTFHELWQLQWRPEFVVRVIEVARWGNSVAEASAAIARDIADHASDLSALTGLIEQCLLADLPGAMRFVLERFQAKAAVSADVTSLMNALLPLADVLRYGNVRRMDAEMVASVVDGIVVRICIGLPGACMSLNEDAAREILEQLTSVDRALALLQNEEHLGAWRDVLNRLIDRRDLHGLIAGRCCRLLLDASTIGAGDASSRLSFALSTVDPSHAAAWIEGFLAGSGLMLLHDENLWRIIDDWVTQLANDSFTQVLALLRRTFATFTAPERRQMGERIKRGALVFDTTYWSDESLDTERAEAVLPLVARLLGRSC